MFFLINLVLIKDHNYYYLLEILEMFFEKQGYVKINKRNNEI